MSSAEPRHAVMGAALGLLAGAFAFLYLGRYIQFDDTSGFGSDEWVMPFGVVAGFAATASVVVACFESRARRMLGGVLMMLVALLGLLVLAVDGFRFIWSAGEGELWYFAIGLGLLSLALTTPPPPAPTRLDALGRLAKTSGWARVVGYVVVLAVVVLTAFNLGIGHFENTNCSAPDFDGECDLAALEGLLWAAVGFGVVTVLAAVLEARVHHRQTR